MDKCPFCNLEVEDEFNFCPYCSEPLTEKGKEVEHSKEKKAQLKLVTALARTISDEATLKILGQITDKLSK